jgi:sugar transferase EpsL
MRPNLLGATCKRIIDIVFSFIALVALLPVMILISLAIRLTMGKPILFRQVRPGQHERPFTILKFRTMVQTQSTVVDPSTDAARLTPVGSILRRLSLDELPQLWNVLKGNMSLVGPRPLLMEYLARYTPEQARRHCMKPGMTGLAQIYGRNAITWEEKFQWDIWYIDHWSFWLDLRILLATMKKVFKQSGIHQEGHATMQKFGTERQ